MSHNLPTRSALSASLFVHGSFFVPSRGRCLCGCWGKKSFTCSFTCARGTVALMCGRARVPLVMPAAARFPRAAAAVLMVEKEEKSAAWFRNGVGCSHPDPSALQDPAGDPSLTSLDLPVSLYFGVKVMLRAARANVPARFEGGAGGSARPGAGSSVLDFTGGRRQVSVWVSGLITAQQQQPRQ